ncbi:hypothetical protein ALCH109712_03340 [Alkalicoccus chagannorensis]
MQVKVSIPDAIQSLAKQQGWTRRRYEDYAKAYLSKVHPRLRFMELDGPDALCKTKEDN